MDDLISRQELLNRTINNPLHPPYITERDVLDCPSAQREPISEAYAKAVRNWLICYQLKCVELKGRYTPYEVLGWIVNDWGKEFGE